MVALVAGVTALAAAIGLSILLLGLQRVFASAPTLWDSNDRDITDTSLSVVIPAFDEEQNIEGCLTHVLMSERPCSRWEVIVVDDQSSDNTVKIAEQAIVTVAGADQPGATVLQAGHRPKGERWVGKNWGCCQAMEQVNSEWVLFIDADVTLAPDAIRRALHQSINENADLFSLAPRLTCGCLAEWMVQPIMASLLGLGFPILEANDPASTVAFAAGPFMLFRRDSYNAIGGHRALAGEVVEDLALARRIKEGGFRLRYVLGIDAVDLQMYANLQALWEGWSKNWYLGLDRSISKSLGAGGVVLLMFTLPWLLLPASLTMACLSSQDQILWLSDAGLGLIAILMQLSVRLWTRARFSVPLRHWWLMGLGGMIIGLIAPTSVWKSLTGRGWTWKGRSLADAQAR
ncbi:glycosyltransferase family 2 protein [Synechococcus sp. MVIR-18-1]|uniref:glycosyltransferase n=1 Tax=Synechococcus sp. MVIR-18-1 TaxID=1386941 RepID=UPI0021035108|nr:glycosyltransferase family 2 protein [Synechococcus sp. MVIR-18-1]